MRSRAPVLPVLFLMIAGLVALACGGDDPFAPRPAASVEITPGADTLYALGETTQLSARAFDADGKEILTAEFTWSCDNCDITEVVGATGAVSAVSNGVGRITATVVESDVSGSIEIAVFQMATSVTVTPATPVLNSIGGTQQFSASPVDANGNAVAGATVLWLSSDHRVATISEDGLATSTGPGTARITAAVQGVPGNASLTVNQDAEQLVFITNPGNGTAGAALSPAIQVEVQDADGNRVAASEAAVTLALATGTGVLSGTHTVNAVNGVATFSGMWLDKVGSYTLSATSSGMVAATSVSFAIAAGPPARLSFTGDPANADGNEPIAVEVTITDDWDNVVPTATNEVTLRFDNNPTGADLLGTRTANAAGGTATFSVRVDKPGTGYALQARAEGLSSALSSDFTVSLHFTQLADGPQNFHSCGLTVGGHAYCWGGNWDGQLGNGTSNASPEPVLVVGDHRFTDITAGYVHTCAVTEDNDAYCWGANWEGMLGDNSQTRRFEPTLVSGGHSFRSITAGYYHTCGIDVGDVARCWGGNYDGQLGTNNTTRSLVPVGLAGGQTVFASMDAGGFHTCGIAGGLMYCWGQDATGQVGNGSASQADVLQPTAIGPAGTFYKTISAGYRHNCATTTESGGVERARCWGYNGYGQIGDGSTTVAYAPIYTQVANPGDDDYVEMQAGREHTCAIKPDDTPYCWGRNSEGQVGEGTTDSPKTTRVLVVGDFDFTTLGLGAYHSCAIAADGDTYCWGSGGNGELGTGAFVSTNIPVRIRQ